MTQTLHPAVSFSAEPECLTTLDITVLMGGPSSEREVSLNSGAAVADALKSVGHTVERCDISPDDLSALEHYADVVFIALHGTFGEDGEIQNILERRFINYTGSDAAASRLAMDKPSAKSAFVAAGVPTPRFDIVTRKRIDVAVSNWIPPVMVKPTDQGSSVDTVIARDTKTLHSVLDRLIAKYGRCMIEQYIDGPELTVGILDDEALPVLCIRTARGFYDYQAKYQDDDTEYVFDFGMSEALLANIRSMSLDAHQALGCRDFSRVDWMVDRRTMTPYCLEVNTIPGFTSHSLLPKAASRVGLSFADLCQRIVELAMDREG